MNIPERLSDFLTDHRGLVIRVCAGVLVLFAGILALLISLSRAEAAKAREIAESRARRAIPIEDLYLPDDPMGLPGVQLSRERRLFWPPDERDLWYHPIGQDELSALAESARRQIDDLLESVP
jgi:hypothetical protein